MSQEQKQTAENKNSAALTQWVKTLPSTVLPAGFVREQLTLMPVPGDAGFRAYFRLTNCPTPLLAVYAPPATEKNKQFVAIANYLAEHGVRVPKVCAVDYERGFLLIEDFGDGLLQPQLTSDNVQGIYGEVLMALLHMQSVPVSEEIFPEYSEQLLRTELNVFCEWFVEGMLSYSLRAEDRALIEGAFDLLVSSALSQPQVIVHRDFHSRNILMSNTPSGCEAPAFIDFQDAVRGPITYDLVSLLRDCYIKWPQQQVEQWALAYGNLLLDAGLIPPVSQVEFLRWFDLMGLQRHIKVLGVFSRLYLRDGKSGYLADLPLVVEYVRAGLAKYPELQPFTAWFDELLLPLVVQQPWFTRYTNIPR